MTQYSGKLLGLRRSSIIILLLLFLIKPACAQSSFAGLPYVRNFQTEEYNAGFQNFNIQQDRRGFLYVANNYGLLEYDGNRWRTYGVKSGTKVRSVAIDGRGRIYVGCQGDFGFFFPNKKGQLTYTSLADSLETKYRNFDETWSIFIDNETIYFCTFSNIYIYNGKTFKVIEPQSPLDLSFLVNRQLYVTEPRSGISLVDKTQLGKMEGGDFFKNKNVSSILPQSNEHLLISTNQHGIFQLTDGEAKPWNEQYQTLFKEANINCMIQLKNGQFAAGTQNEGLLVLDSNGNLVVHLTKDRGLENRTVLCLYEDDLHHLWVGQNNAIAYIELGSPFTFLNEQSGLSGIGYAAYLDETQLYLGTNTGLYIKDKEEPGNFRLVENTKGQVYTIGKHKTDLLVAHQNGAFRLEEKKAVKLSGTPGSWVFLSLKNRPDQLIEGTYTGLQLYKLKDQHWQFQKRLKGFSESSRVMAAGGDGTIWVTHGYKGAFKIELNEAGDSIVSSSFYGSEKGFPTNRLINVFQVRNELIFTGENGVYVYDPVADTFIPDNLFSKTFGKGAQLWFVQEDALGNIYFIGREHLGALRKNSVGDYVLYESEFNRIRKYLNDDLENIIILKNNEVLFAAKDGFIHYDPAVPFGLKSKFKTFIRQVSAATNGDSILFNGNYSDADSVINKQTDSFKPTLPYRMNSVRFSYSAASFEGNLVYQYYLENFEKEWSSWEATAQKEYTNLKEKGYTFHVRSKNSSGVISEETTYSFRVNPPWYRSQWAYGFYGLSVASFLIAGFMLMDRNYQRQRKKMVITQEKELIKKDTEMEKLSLQKQEEITRLQNEKLEAELNHMKNELATATMHLLNKNEFITHIKANLNQIGKKSTEHELKTELSGISKDIENNISDDSDWEHFQFHFDRVHGDFTTRLKAAFTSLSPQETKLCAYLRMNLSSKEIAQLLNISVRGVEISRYRLRKKLNLDRLKNLQEFILNF
jgi:Bacterial regulatory proteins, luxR family